MKINGTQFRTIWPARDGRSVTIIDQTRLPHRFETATLGSVEDAARAITTMQVRGAPPTASGSAWGTTRPMRASTS
jgi:methylthioribose-1-phosphate isomerase